MRTLRKLHGRVAPPGFELRLLRALPAAALASIAVPLLMAWGARIYTRHQFMDNAAKFVKTVDIFAWSIALTLLTAVLTVSIGCIVVWVMKGPAYVADAYPVAHANRPAHDRADSAAEDNRTS